MIVKAKQTSDPFTLYEMAMEDDKKRLGVCCCSGFGCLGGLLFISLDFDRSQIM